MARIEVIEAVNSHLAANWTATPIVEMNNADEENRIPAKGDPYIMATFPVADEEQVSVGAPTQNVFRETGAFQIKLYQKRGHDGLKPAGEMARDLAALFRGRRLATGLRCMEVDTSSLADENERGSYFVVGVAVRYEHDIFA